MISSPKKSIPSVFSSTPLTVQIVPNQLTWIIADKPPQQKQSLICFNTQRLSHKIAEGLTVQELQKFLVFIEDLLQRHPKVVYFTKNDENNILISCIIVSLYKMVILNSKVIQIQQFIKNLNLPLKQFGNPDLISYEVNTVIRCINIVKSNGFIGKTTQEAKIDSKQGIVYRLIPNKLFAFEYFKPKLEMKQPEKNKNIWQFVKVLKQLNITKAIGFEGQYEFPYNPNQFSLNGIQHRMTTIFNSSDPEIDVIEKTIDSIKHEDVYAINSQDNFGLSMLFAAAYSIKVLKYTLEQSICWCRMIVPECINQRQLLWLKKKYKALAGIDTYITAEKALKQIKKNGIVLTTDVQM